MLPNNNLKICRILVWRDFRLHKAKNLFLILAVTLIAGMDTFLFLLGGSVKTAARADAAGRTVSSFYLLLLPVFLCGFLMVYGILHVALGQELRYLAGLKIVGMTPRQIRWMLLVQAASVTLLGLIPGWLLGLGIHLAATPQILTGMGRAALPGLTSLADFLAAALCCGGTVLLACFLPVSRLGRMMPAEAFCYGGTRIRESRKKSRKAQVTLLRLALRTLLRDAGRLFLSALSLLLSVVLLNAVWIQYISYDEGLYLSTMSPWDYSVTSAVEAGAYYKDEDSAITQKVAEDLAARPEVTAAGALKSKEVELAAPPELRELLLTYYNGVNEGGRPRKEAMAKNKAWMDGLERLKSEGTYRAVVVGINGLYSDYLLSTSSVVSGNELSAGFARGEGILTSGAADGELSTLPAGASVELGGERLPIIASINVKSNFLIGRNSRQAEFCLYYYMPLTEFDRLFPGGSYRQMALNIDRRGQESFEAYLQGIGQAGMGVLSQSDYRERFQDNRFRDVLVGFAAGTILFVVGLMNFVNMLIARVVARKREFAVYESLGMTRRLLVRFLLLEGFVHASILALLLFPAGFLATWFGMPVLLGAIGSWCVTYRFTLSPLWTGLILLVLLALFLPAACMGLVCRGSTAERLKRLV